MVFAPELGGVIQYHYKHRDLSPEVLATATLYAVVGGSGVGVEELDTGEFCHLHVSIHI